MRENRTSGLLFYLYFLSKKKKHINTEKETVLVGVLQRNRINWVCVCERREGGG